MGILIWHACMWKAGQKTSSDGKGLEFLSKIQDQNVKVSGEALGPRRFRLSAGIDPTYRGPASLEAVSESSVSVAQVAGIDL